MLGQYSDVIEKRISISREVNCDCTDNIRSRGRSVIEERAESENVKAKGRIKDFVIENSEENF